MYMWSEVSVINNRSLISAHFIMHVYRQDMQCQGSLVDKQPEGMTQ